MKKGIHPTYYPDATVTCASCGTTWKTGSTKPEIRVETCSNCHPYFTGEQGRIIDIEGQVDRFYKKVQVHQDFVEQKKLRAQSKVSPKRPIVELELTARSTQALDKAGIKEVGQFLERLAKGEENLLAIDGFGRKSLIDIKKKLRSLGYELPEITEIPAA
jgi:large subunit ribosomal protein L31